MGAPIDWSDVSNLHIETETGAKVVAVTECGSRWMNVSFDRDPGDGRGRLARSFNRQTGVHQLGTLPSITNIVHALPPHSAPYFVVSRSVKPFETREAAEREADQRSREFPDHEFMVVGSLSSHKLTTIVPPVEKTQLAA